MSKYTKDDIIKFFSTDKNTLGERYYYPSGCDCRVAHFQIVVCQGFPEKSHTTDCDFEQRIKNV